MLSRSLSLSLARSLALCLCFPLSREWRRTCRCARGPYRGGIPSHRSPLSTSHTAFLRVLRAIICGRASRVWRDRVNLPSCQSATSSQARHTKGAGTDLLSLSLSLSLTRSLSWPFSRALSHSRGVETNMPLRRGSLSRRYARPLRTHTSSGGAPRIIRQSKNSPTTCAWGFELKVSELSRSGLNSGTQTVTRESPSPPSTYTSDAPGISEVSGS